MRSKPRPRRRETTPDDALADARAALERAIASIDREVVVAEERAAESGGGGQGPEGQRGRSQEGDHRTLGGTEVSQRGPVWTFVRTGPHPPINRLLESPT